ncbi:PIH1 domain-containing protein 2-like [Ctenocephalides felis]|uniref:PIH1 domain-containing protein 2-like n=1 Tax=Ctenocephalides felis TaxID=7515 RepID=UPI000E6E51B1|nr:PIH1 domain-containing protein 2-like [Ctenocephalides felis]
MSQSNYLGSSEASDRPIPVMKSLRSLSNFKNPPQPHMCIRDSTKDGNELFINVLSWNKIAMPKSAQDPIPLYGGMRVPPTSSNTPPLVFAVMANPDILKTNGRLCKDPVELMALVELMCDFVEAMNPGLVLKRQAEVLPERELSGELKDVWTAIQYKRESEQSMSYLLSKSYQSESGLQSNIPKQAKLVNSDMNVKIYHIDPNPSENKDETISSTTADCQEDESKNDKNSSSLTSTNKSLLKSGKDFFRNDFFPQFKSKKSIDNDVNIDKESSNNTNNIEVTSGNVNFDPDINISKLNLE